MSNFKTLDELYAQSSTELEAKRLAVEIIAHLKRFNNIDYTPQQDHIISTVEDYGDNWDFYIEFGDKNFPDIRVIQEDEYEQSMDEDEQPENVSLVCGYYIGINI